MAEPFSNQNPTQNGPQGVQFTPVNRISEQGGAVSEFQTILDCAYRWEKEAPDRTYFTQPVGGGDANLHRRHTSGSLTNAGAPDAGERHVGRDGPES